MSLRHFVLGESTFCQHWEDRIVATSGALRIYKQHPWKFSVKRTLASADFVGSEQSLSSVRWCRKSYNTFRNTQYLTSCMSSERQMTLKWGGEIEWQCNRNMNKTKTKAKKSRHFPGGILKQEILIKGVKTQLRWKTEHEPACLRQGVKIVQPCESQQVHQFLWRLLCSYVDIAADLMY